MDQVSPLVRIPFCVCQMIHTTRLVSIARTSEQGVCARRGAEAHHTLEHEPFAHRTQLGLEGARVATVTTGFLLHRNHHIHMSIGKTERHMHDGDTGAWVTFKLMGFGVKVEQPRLGSQDQLPEREDNSRSESTAHSRSKPRCTVPTSRVFDMRPFLLTTVPWSNSISPSGSRSCLSSTTRTRFCQTNHTQSGILLTASAKRAQHVPRAGRGLTVRTKQTTENTKKHLG